MTTTEILEEAKRLLIVKGWCQNSLAISEDGYSVSWSNPTAASYCAVGAIAKASTSFQFGIQGECFDLLNMSIPPIFLDIVHANNDPNTTNEMVLEWFDIAIALSRIQNKEQTTDQLTAALQGEANEVFHVMGQH